MKIYCSIVLVLVGAFSALGQKNSILIDLTDSRRLITHRIDKNLILRIIKDRSVTQENFGWVIEVNRRSFKPSSENLIYTNKSGNGADRSQVAAWQFSEFDPKFPARRRLKVRGAPYIIEINVINPQAEGKTDDAAFLSGQLRVAWHRQLR